VKAWLSTAVTITVVTVAKFLGIPGQHDVVQVNCAAIAGRSAYFPTDLPPGKAKKISQGKGHVEVRKGRG